MSRFGAAILGCAGARLTADEAALYAQMRPFGFILFGRNLYDADQIRALCDQMRTAAGHDAPVFIDQEGGRVQRLRPPLAREFRPPLDDAGLDDAGPDDAGLHDAGPDDAGLRDAGPGAGPGARAFYLRARIIAHELRALGIDGNCIPTLDVARDDTHAVLRNRCYGTDVDTVVRHGRAVADGLLAGGVLPVMKHMPGHGLGTLDSHKDLPRVAADRAVLDAVDFAAFAALNDLPLGMSAHLVFEAIDPRPATVSPVMVALIREQIGFGGLLMTDDISMQALSGTVPERGAAALAAGCDLVLHCNGDLSEMQALWDRCGLMTEAAQTRAQAALSARHAPDDVDIAALQAEFDALVS